MSRKTTNIEALIEPTIIGLGYELVGCVFVPQAHHTLLRIYIDSERGITVDDCELVSRQVSALLDVEDPIAGSYSLEVSSPGLRRPLFKKAHFERFKGEKALVQLHIPETNKQKNFTGILQAVVDENLIMNIEGQEFTFALDNIAKANLLPEIKIQARGKKSHE